MTTPTGVHKSPSSTSPTRRRVPSISRSQQQIRSGLYLKLGLLNNTPQNAASKRPTRPALPSCLNKKPHSAIHATEEKRVTFYEQVVVRNIPSHQDLDQETWDRLYHDPDAMKKEMKRNKYEFWVDGGNWRRATEEEEFFRAEDGSLVHPASWSLMANLAYQYRLAFQNHYGQDEDPTSVTEVDSHSPRSYVGTGSVHCPYKNDSCQYGYPHKPPQPKYNTRRNNTRRRAARPMYVSPIQA